ncbi:MAG: DNA polymerase III subunit delta [Oscillospiraceae bacterium]
MAKIEEARLKADLKSGQLARVYFLYGEEHFLTKTYENRIIDAALGKEYSELNFVRWNEAPSSDTLSDFAESMPFFAEYKVMVISDLDADKLDNAEMNAYLGIIESLPDTSILIISQTGIEIDPKKPKAKMKKLMAAAEKCGVLCEMKYMSAAQLGKMAVKKAARLGCNLSESNSVLLAEICGRDMNLVSLEVQKLCDYTMSGEITREAIEALVPKLVDTSIYTLASELFAGRTANAFRILDDLFVQRMEPVVILAALSGHFVDCYRAKLAMLAKKSANDAAAAFNYPRNRTFVLSKAYNSVKYLSLGYLEQCISILYRTNKLLNSSKADRRTLLERAITEISVLKRT